MSAWKPTPEAIAEYRRREKAKRDRLRRESGTIKCACGCGTDIWALTSQLKPARYAMNHHHGRRLKPGMTINTGLGYIMEFQPDHPRANSSNGFVKQHILVWERHHGRALPEDCVIHHRNNIRHDNRIENLEMMHRREHNRMHATEQMAALTLEEKRRRSEKMVATKRRKGMVCDDPCTRCGAPEHHAKGLCYRCYLKDWHLKRTPTG